MWSAERIVEASGEDGGRPRRSHITTAPRPPVLGVSVGGGVGLILFNSRATPSAPLNPDNPLLLFLFLARFWSLENDSQQRRGRPNKAQQGA